MVHFPRPDRPAIENHHGANVPLHPKGRPTFNVVLDTRRTLVRTYSVLLASKVASPSQPTIYPPPEPYSLGDLKWREEHTDLHLTT